MLHTNNNEGKSYTNSGIIQLLIMWVCSNGQIL